MNVVQSLGLQAGRAADTAIGATLAAAENVAGAVRPLRDPRGEAKRLRGELDANVRKLERRGAQTRKRTTREVARRRDRALRAVRRTRSDVTDQVDATRREVRSRADGFAATVQDQAQRLS